MNQCWFGEQLTVAYELTEKVNLITWSGQKNDELRLAMTSITKSHTTSSFNFALVTILRDKR